MPSLLYKPTHALPLLHRIPLSFLVPFSTSIISPLMGTQSKQSLLFGLCLVTLAFGFTGAEKTVTVVGSTECLDCAEKNIKAEQAFKGLRVAIKCKSATGLYETKGVSQLDKSGNFHVNLPIDLLHEESEGSATLKPACVAEIRDRANKACPKPDPLTLTLASKEKDQHTFTVGENGKLPILSSICTSATFWPPKWDPLHKKPIYCHPWFKKFCGPEPTPPVPEYKPPTPTYGPPVYKPPTPTYGSPVYKPPTPTYGAPVYKPPTPTYGPPVPEYKPTPTPVPVYEPKPTPKPVYKPPLYHPHPKFDLPPHPWKKYFPKKPYFPPADNKN
ncbi:Proline-rich protein 2 [Rhynchospora pubera]|uniref:Proline-rich protein 2 n=1 Tax=Rhynchospora pubera TaxID=906938 RepID=A0AAV8F1I8_9POAL|nr:Proline-rich protein 2 [Rhynchospora pubera]